MFMECITETGDKGLARAQYESRAWREDLRLAVDDGSKVCVSCKNSAILLF